jgi:single-strand DNA-binding protein
MSNDVNSVVIVGRLVKDAELRMTASGLAVSSFSIASNYRKKSGEEWVDAASFVEVSMFGKSAEAVNQYLTKGKQIAVEGELRQDRWEQDGQNRSKVHIIADNVQLLGGTQNAADGETHGKPALTQGSGQRSSAEGQSSDIYDDEIGF